MPENTVVVEANIIRSINGTQNVIIDNMVRCFVRLGEVIELAKVAGDGGPVEADEIIDHCNVALGAVASTTVVATLARDVAAGIVEGAVSDADADCEAE